VEKRKSYRDGMTGLKDTLSPRWGLKGALEKKMRARRRTQMNGRGLKGALERGEGSKAH
jgi:hypothetical protein